MTLRLCEPQADVLDSLANLGPCSRNDLAEDTGRDRKAVSMALERLKRRGFARRERQNVWTITDEGQRALAAREAA